MSFTLQFFCRAQKTLHKINFSLFKSIITNNSVKKYCKKTNVLANKAKICPKITTSDDPNFSDNLIKWAIQNNISLLAFSKLLKVLREYGISDLPASSRTLLQAKEDNIKVINIPPGTYTHFGFEKNLKTLMSSLIEKNMFNNNDISVSVFIDQLPLVKSTNQSLWVILGSVEGFLNNIFFIGAYCGFSKPNNSNLYLSEFVKEAKDLVEKGLEIYDVIYNVRIKRLICDAPAKSFVLNIKNFMGYSSCTKCNTVGVFNSKKICFLKKSTPRKDEDFEKDEMYTDEKTALLEIPNFGVVSNVTIDYMHLVCLGVVQKLLKIWLTNEKVWISEKSASDLIQELADVYPCEFRHKPKTLKLFQFWEASEFRQFLLYFGPVLLKNNLKENYYNHFLLLHVACRLLCSEASVENINCGRQLLNDFVEDYKNLYETEQITHNFHNLYHLADECVSHGVLDNFSSFPFEKFLIKLRNQVIKSRKKFVPQIILAECYDKIFKSGLDCLRSDSYKVLKKIKEDESEDFFYYEKLLLQNFDIMPNSEGDNYVFLKSGKIIKVVSVMEMKKKPKKCFIAGKEFCNVCNFHSKPFEGLKLGMFKVGKLSNNVKMWPVDLIGRKAMKVPIEGEQFVLISLLDINF